FFSSRRRHTRFSRDWSSDVCSSDLGDYQNMVAVDGVVGSGSWLAQDTYQIVSGWGIAANISFGVLDYGKSVSLSVPKPGKGQVSDRKSVVEGKRVVVGGGRIIEVEW